MTKRAWWLVVLNLLIPGSAQLLAGNRRLGRFGVRATVLLWVLAIAAVVLLFVARPVLLTLATNPIALTAGQVLLVGYAALWVVLTLDTLRLVRLIRARPAARPFIAALSVVALVVGAGFAGYGAYLAGVTRGTVNADFRQRTVRGPGGRPLQHPAARRRCRPRPDGDAPGQPLGGEHRRGHRPGRP